jgi:hypothetical protein
MTCRQSVSRWLPRQSSLPVLVRTERTTLVYPPLCPPFVSHTAWGQMQPPCLPPAFVYLRLYLFARVLTGSVTIGRVRQTL